MSDGAPQAAAHGSSRPARASGPAGLLPAPGTLALRGAFALAAVAGVLLSLIATWTVVSRIKAVTTSDLLGGQTAFTGWDLHGPALALLALVGLVLTAGALRGARPAAWGLLALSVVMLVLIAAVDVPQLDDTRDLSASYEGVSAGAASGFYLETLGAVLLLLAAGGLLLVGARSRNDERRPGGRRSGPAEAAG